MAKQKKQRIKRKELVNSLKQAARSGQIDIVDVRTGTHEKVNVEDIKGVFQLSEDESREYAVQRVTLNLKATKHPYHHKTATGVIVASDPTLEYLLSKLSEEKLKQFHAIYAPTPEQEAQAPNAVPVNRMYYGQDMYEGLY